MKPILCLLLTLTSLTLPPKVAWSVPAEGTQVMISGPSPLAVGMGVELAEAGGNAVDVAVGVALALAVTSPYYAALGGGGFALVSMGSGVEALDFRETAPKAAKANMFQDKDKNTSRDGGLAVGVPGIPAGLWALHKKYGKLHWSRLFVGPVRLAQKGFRVSGEWARLTEQNKARFNNAGKKTFLKANGAAYKPGELFIQKDLGRALSEMSNRNIASFYGGIVAQDIVKSVRQAGGVISMEDLHDYKVRWLKPISTDFLGHTVHLMPPPSSGGVVIASALNLIDRLKLQQYPAMSGKELHMMAEILSRSFRSRSELGDPDFHQNPIDKLLAPTHLKAMAESISEDGSKALEPFTLKAGSESTETTHLSVMDQNGHAVSMTLTLNGSYGSGVVSERFGIALNNEMDDFTTQPNEPNMYGLVQGPANAVEPGKRPLSSMSPTLVEKNKKVVMSLGAPGGPRIISVVIQVLYRALANQMDLDWAVQAPRVHHQFFPHELLIDNARMSPDTKLDLEKRGHKLVEGWVGKAYVVRRNSKGFLEGAFDSRGEGAAAGF